MYRTTRTSTICVTIAAATVAIILLTSATLTASVYATRHHSHPVHSFSVLDLPACFEFILKKMLTILKAI
jgi:hypothetical protein